VCQSGDALSRVRKTPTTATAVGRQALADAVRVVARQT
jgi:hypothetical protein